MLNSATAKHAILEEWAKYCRDPQTTITPGSFFRWLSAHRPELLEFESDVSKTEQIKRWIGEP